MKRAIFRLHLLSMMIFHLISNAFNSTSAAIQPTGEHLTHICGFSDLQQGQRYKEQYPHRRYARSTLHQSISELWCTFPSHRAGRSYPIG